MKSTVLKTLICLCTLPVIFSFAEAQIQQEPSTIFDMLYGEEPVEVSIFTDFEQLDSLRNTNEYQAAAFAFEYKDTESKWGIKLRTRGKFRRRICNQPPLKLNFDKDDLVAYGLQKDDELKLVTQCVPGYVGKDYVLREYLSYQLYNILSPHSFRAQLVKLEYNCTSTGKKEKSWGIILEDKNTLERRLNSEKCGDCYGRPREEFDEQSLGRATLFQYMIANADYSLNQARNLELFRNKESGKLFVAPYDFDFSGLVNASYALPNPDYQQKRVRDRVFLGHSSDEQLAETIAYFKEKKPEIMAYVDDAKYLAKGSRRDIEKYIESFYDSLDEGLVRPK